MPKLKIKATIEPKEIEGGNTKTPSISTEETQKEEKQSNQCINWCFTWNNYTIESIESIVPILNNLCISYVFQEEVGDSGTPHLQGTFHLKKKARWTEFGLPRCIHFEKCVHLPNAYEYCSRLNKRKEGGQCYTLNWNAPREVKLIKPEQFYKWQTDFIVEILKEPDDRKIYWIYSLNGRVGKSQFCKYLIAKHNAVCAGKGRYNDICNLIYKSDMDKSNLVVFDLPRICGNKISYSALECIKNGFICNTKFETGSCMFNPPHILVFSNCEPDYSAMSNDRFTVVNVDM